jgi:hypothetical protein
MTSAQLLPLPTTPSPPSSALGPAIEQLIAARVATAASLVARGLGELWQSGQIRMNADTKRQGSGARALRECCDGAVSQRTIDELVAAVLEILGGIVRLRLH